MSLYFESLPVEIRSELLKYLPKSYLFEATTNGLRKHANTPYIFDIMCFKICDTNDFWRSMYEYKYKYNIKSVDDKTNINYKNSYHKCYISYVKFTIDKLKFAMQNGHDKILLQERKNNPGVWLNFDELFLEATNYLQANCMYLINRIVKFQRKTYQDALNILLSKLNNNFDLVEELINILLDYEVVFPKIEFLSCNVIMWMDRKMDDCLLLNKPFLQFAIKHKMITNLKKVCEYFIYHHVNTDVFIDYITDHNIPLDTELFKYTLQLERFKYIELFIEHGYKINVDDIHKAASCTRQIFDYILGIYSSNLMKNTSKS